MSKNSQAFIAILPLLGVLALAPLEVEKLGRGIASDTPEQEVKPTPKKDEAKEVKAEVVQTKEEVKKDEVKKDDVKKEEPKKEVAKEEPKKEEVKKEEVKKEDVKKEEAKIVVTEAKKVEKEDKKEEKKEEEKKEDCADGESLKVVSSQLKELMTQQQTLVAQMGQMQQQMLQQKSELEWKILFSSINQASMQQSFGQIASQYFQQANPYAQAFPGGQYPYMQQVMGMGMGMGMYGQYPGGMMGGMGGMGYMGQSPYMQQPMQQQPQQIYSTPIEAYQPMQVNPGQFSVGNNGFDMSNPAAQTNYPTPGNFGVGLQAVARPAPASPLIPGPASSSPGIVPQNIQGQNYGFTL